MPWQIQAATSDEWELQWCDKLTKAEIDNLPELYSAIGREHGKPFHPDLPVIPYRQNSEHATVPAICHGRWGNNVFVNQEVRSLIEEMDPAAHFFHPIELHLNSGKVIRDTYFLLRMGGLVNAIDPEESQVVAKYKNEKLVRYARLAVRPKITWRADAIAGRHLWMDQYFQDDIYCSDEFMDELKRRNITHFRAIRSYVAN